MAIGPNCAIEKVAGDIKKFESEIDRWLERNYDGADSIYIQLSGVPLTGARTPISTLYREAGWGTVDIHIENSKATIRLHKAKVGNYRLGG